MKLLKSAIGMIGGAAKGGLTGGITGGIARRSRKSDKWNIWWERVKDKGPRKTNETAEPVRTRQHEVSSRA